MLILESVLGRAGAMVMESKKLCGAIGYCFC